jgi:hypothetical protein
VISDTTLNFALGRWGHVGVSTPTMVASQGLVLCDWHKDMTKVILVFGLARANTNLIVGGLQSLVLLKIFITSRSFIPYTWIFATSIHPWLLLQVWFKLGSMHHDRHFMKFAKTTKVNCNVKPLGRGILKIRGLDQVLSESSPTFWEYPSLVGSTHHKAYHEPKHTYTRVHRRGRLFHLLLQSGGILHL